MHKSEVVSFIGFMACFFGGISVLVFLVAWLTFPIRAYSCESRWAPVPTEYTWMGGCRVQTGFGKDSFVPEKNIRLGN